ncbi:hypothetical protein J6590_080303 [Homalodisca vitripennis]|nr:hypothetical protein J6590_080303 [Homalodisca vitripennis]
MALTPVTEEEVAGVMRSLRVSKSTGRKWDSSVALGRLAAPVPLTALTGTLLNPNITRRAIKPENQVASAERVRPLRTVAAAGKQLVRNQSRSTT